MPRPSSTITNIPLYLSVLILWVFVSPTAHAATELKFNCGGYKIDDYSSDPVALISGESTIYQLNESVSNLTVGLTHRWGSDKGFAYEFPTGDGQFDVDLIFAEIYPPAQSESRRIFDIFIEDTLSIKNIDVFREKGSNIELYRTVKNSVVEDGALTVAFRKGSIENPMVSAIVIRASNGSDVSISRYTVTDGISEQSAPTGSEWDHQAHAIAGGPYKATDYNGNGQADVFIDGRLSHSHYNNPSTGDTGRIVAYDWRIGTDAISTSVTYNYAFPVGTTELSLKVTDQTGNSATAMTTVTVLPATAAGVYCYYYSDATSLPIVLNDEPRPDEGHSANIINFFSNSFLYSRMNNDDGSPKVWAARCVTDFQSVSTASYTFGVRYRGAGAELYVNGGRKAVGGDTAGSVKTITAQVVVTDATVGVQIFFYSGGVREPQLALLVNDQIASPIALSYKTAFVLPCISGLSSTQAQPQGGSQLQITGTGFFNNVTVSIGPVTVDRQIISAQLIQIPSIPSVDAITSNVQGEDEAAVIVSNNAGSSNALRITYSTNAKKGIAWEQTYFKQGDGSVYFMKQVTTVKIGPDGNYYSGTLGGFVSRMKVGKDLIVVEKCDSKKIGNNRVILGMAFNYASPIVRLYVSTSTLYVSTGVDERAWANGAIDLIADKSVVPCSECMCYERRVISGLPVSGRDHGVNALLFVNGDLLIAVGGATNVGIPSEEFGGIAESPLSGAILLGQLSKGSSFNGQITYDNYAEPGSAKQISGDVQVYASGLRNCFGMTQHTNGQIWATDNGPNIGFGDISTGCGTETPIGSSVKDEVNLIIQGGNYGHPNRNRNQCVYNDGIGPVLKMVSATTGIVEYTGNAFSGTLQGELILSQFEASGTGKTWRTSIQGNSLSGPLPMTDYSGLSIENGFHGELIMPRVQGGYVSVLKPVYSYSGTGPFVIAVSPNRGVPGIQVFVGGEGFEEGLVAYFGGIASTSISFVDANGFFCVVPNGAGTTDVEVFVDGVSSKGSSGQGGTVKFIYL